MPTFARPTDPDDVLTLGDLAALLKLGSVKTAQRALDAGELPVPSFYVRGKPRWVWREVRRWLRVRHHHPGRTHHPGPEPTTPPGRQGQNRPNRDTG